MKLRAKTVTAGRFRRRLLPQPGGFEGFSLVEIGPDTDRPPVLELDQDAPIAVMSFTIVGGKIVEMDLLADPVRLRELDLDLG
jgi:hypothetical protein